VYFWIVTLRQALREPEARGAVRSAALLLLTGVLFYTVIEHWTFVDSLYFCVTTLTTVGFGSPAPTTDAGKLFTVFFVLTGVGMFLAVINGIGRAAVKNQIDTIERRGTRRRGGRGGAQPDDAAPESPVSIEASSPIVDDEA
jgi:hypothetical protein